jgi:hypothetical protein
MYFNSFGFPETFHTSVDWVETMNVSTDIAKRSAAFGLKSLFPQSFVFDSRHQNSMKARTGVLSNKAAVRLQAVINSMIALVQEGNRWIPVILNTGKTSIIQLSEFTQQIDLEILKANENDRASFFPLQPDFTVIEGNGIARLNVQTNDLKITVFGNIIAYNGSTEIATFIYNAALKYYTTAAPIYISGTFKFEGTFQTATETFKVIKHHKYSAKTVIAYCSEIGTVDIGIRTPTGLGGITVDWGDGVIENVIYGPTLFSMAHTYTKTGKKTIRLTNNSFAHIAELSFYFDFGKIDLGEFTNLVKFSYLNGPSGNWYFSQLTKMQNIYMNQTNVSNIEVGFQKDLLFVTLYDTAITSNALDNLLLELWKYRKLYSSVVGVYIGTLGYTPSSFAISISNGTGVYAGEGLVTNYGWTVNLW